MDIKNTLELIGLSATIAAVVSTAVHHVGTLTLDKRLAELENRWREHESRWLDKLNGRYVYRGEYTEHVRLVEQRLERLED